MCTAYVLCLLASLTTLITITRPRKATAMDPDKYGDPLGPIPAGPISYPGPLGVPGEDRAREELLSVLADAGVELGEYDARIAAWLAGWEWSTVATIAGWIKRANRPGDGDGKRCQTCGGVGATTMPDPFTTALYPERDHHESMTLCESCATARFEDS